MFRFVAFVWTGGNTRAKKAAAALAERLPQGTADWRLALQADGLAIHCHDIHSGSSGVSFLHNDAGAVLGRIFAKGKALDLNEDESAAIVESLGRRLITHYWGRYVAFIRDAESGTTVVLRDPTSALPCFYVQTDGLHIFFSHMDEGTRLVDRGFTINWSYVHTALCKFRNHLHTTGLNEVTQVLGGESLEISARGTTRRFLWNVLDFARADPIETPERAALLLYEQTRECVHAWASTHASIVFQLSGGPLPSWRPA
jgi:asparagine synthase (glutamine-hydrolysing)